MTSSTTPLPACEPSAAPHLACEPSAAPHLVWLRRDLRLQDQAALAAALRASRSVHVAFVLDTDILQALPSRTDRRVDFILHCLSGLDSALREAGAALIVMHGSGPDCIADLVSSLGIKVVHAARDYEPQAVARDAEVARRLALQGAALQLHKDQVVFETDEVLSATGKPYSVFTPYRNAWMKRLQAEPQALVEHEVSDALMRERLVAEPMARAQLTAVHPRGLLPGVPDPQAIGFEATGLEALGIQAGAAGARALVEDFLGRIGRYQEARDEPARRGPSYLSVHLRFGTIAVRALAREALAVMQQHPTDAAGAQTWLNELIWREFYFQILHHHPHSARQSFKPEFDAIVWEQGPQAERLWQAFVTGKTGYPLVDAAIRQILHSGYMHNRLRMVVASFLCKDLGLDWRLGERWFAEHLIDFDLSANVGGWQWAASSGCDAQPWFRIFNPVTQSRRFDAQGRFIRRYLPELARFSDQQIHEPWLASGAQQAAAGCIIGRDYPKPVVDHAQARTRTLARYEVVKRPISSSSSASS
jgi:deoxyribodipyrimidine photo-lyase